MTTTLNYEDVFDSGSSISRTFIGKYFNIKTFNNDGIMVLDIVFNASIDAVTVAEAVASCFKYGSNSKVLNTIKFYFKGLYVTVTPENATVEKILELWEQKNKERSILDKKRLEEYMKTPEYAAKLAEQQERADTREKIIEVDDTTEMEFKDYTSSVRWAEFANTDFRSVYANNAVVFARRWAKYMQYKISQGHMLKDIAFSTSKDANIDNISDVLYGTAVKILIQCWKHGEELRQLRV